MFGRVQIIKEYLKVQITRLINFTIALKDYLNELGNFSIFLPFQMIYITEYDQSDLLFCTLIHLSHHFLKI